MTTPRSGIIFVHPSDELYGADRMLLELLEALPDPSDAEVWLPVDLEHQPHPLCERLESDGYAVRHLDLPIMRRRYRTPSGIRMLVGRAIRLHREIRRVKPRVVYCTTSAAFIAAPIARVAGVPEVLGHVQEVWSRSDRAVLGSLATSLHKIVAISQAARMSLPSRLRQRSRVVLNATRTPAHTAQLAERGTSLTFLVASRWNDSKGYPTLLRAWDLAGAPGQLIILGGPPPIGGQVDVPGIVARSAHPETITVIGEVPNPAPYIAEADVVLMPSDYPEGFGLVAIEAFSRGLPVIASAAGGLLEIVTPGRDGWLFAPGDAHALAAVLAQLDRCQVSVAGALARQTFETRFTIDRFAGEWREAVFGAGSSAST